MAGGDEELLSGAKPAVSELDLRRTADAVKQRLFGAEPAPVKLGRFVLIDKLGAGRMGSVFSAYDPTLDRRVAVKLIRREHIGEEHVAVRQRRLEREAAAMAKITHPNVVTVHEVGEHEGQVFIAMELVEGMTLRAWLDREPAVGDALEMFSSLAVGLGAAHEAGIVHRDFKPDNVLVDRRGRPRITDFGLSSVSPMVETRDGAGVHETRDGVILGTPSYMAPECLEGGAADARSDQFSFFVALYEAISGARPFAGDSVASLAEAIRAAPPVEVSRSGVSRRVRRAIATGLAADASRRHADMDEVASLLTPPRGRAQIVTTVVAGVALVAAMVALDRSGRGDSAAARCRRGAEQIATTWNEPARDAMRRNFGARAPAYADALWSRAGASLDDYTRTWRTVHEASCRATRIAGTQSDTLFDRRARCLTRRQQELAAMVFALTHGDEPVVRSALQVVEELKPVQLCEGSPGLMGVHALPEDPTRAARARGIQRRITALWAAHAAGNIKAVVAKGGALVADARALGHGPTLADAQLLVGSAHIDAGSKGVARRMLFDAVQTAQASGHVEVVARAATHLLRAAASEQDKQWGQTWFGLADASLARLGRPVTLAAGLSSSWATLLHERTEHKAARAVLDEAIRDMEAAGSSQGPRFVQLLHNLANVHHSMGQYKRSHLLMSRVLALREAMLGSSHPDVAASLNTLAILDEGMGNLTVARDRYRRAADIAKATLGDTSPAAATYLDNLAGALNQLGQGDDALTIRLQALAMREAKWGKDHVQVALPLNNLGSMLQNRGDLPGARAMYERALRIRVAELGASHRDVAATLVNLGECEVLMGDVSKGEDHLRAAAAAAEKALGASHPELAYYHLVLGQVLHKLKGAAAALPHLERALQIGLARPTMYVGELNDTRFALAEALGARGRGRARALALARDAAAYYLGAKKTTAHTRVQEWLAGAGVH